MSYRVRKYFDESIGVYDASHRKMLILKDGVRTIERYTVAERDLPELDATRHGIEINLDPELFNGVFNSAGSRNGSVENALRLEETVRKALEQKG